MDDKTSMPRFRNCDYAPPHVHTEYSPFDGLSKTAKLIQKARAMGFPAMAITDHGRTAGWLRALAEAARKKDKKGNELLIPGTNKPLPTLKMMLGVEIYLCRDHTVHSKDGQPDGTKGNRHLILYAQNWKGYQNICRLQQLAWTKGFYYNARNDIEQLAQYSEGVICSTACLSSIVNNALLHDQFDAAKRALEILHQIYPGRLFVESMYHGIDAEGAIIPDQLKLMKMLGLPGICSNDTHYIEKEHASTHDVFTAISQSTCLHNPKRMKFPYGEFYLKSAEEMGKIYGHHPELIYNTRALSEMIDTEDIENNLFNKMRLPEFKVPPEFKTPSQYLAHLAWEGMKRLKWDKSQPHIDALRKELADVEVALKNNNLDFPSYFLDVWDYVVNFAKKQGIFTGCGRGSGYASVLLRCLGICYGPCPIKYGLIWERFLGFDTSRFYLASDFGLKEKVDLASIVDAAEERAEEEKELNAEEEFEEEEQFA
jgi:DNA polymerase-3 subunit alpha